MIRITKIVTIKPAVKLLARFRQSVFYLHEGLLDYTDQVNSSLQDSFQRLVYALLFCFIYQVVFQK
jgi:hypothetical protein